MTQDQTSALDEVRRIIRSHENARRNGDVRETQDFRGAIERALAVGVPQKDIDGVVRAGLFHMTC